MLYLLYPFLLALLNKNLFIIPLLLLLGYAGMYFTNFFVIDTYRNLITCIASFYFGMIAIKYKDFFFKNRVLAFISFIIFVFLRFVKLPDFILLHQIQGFSLLIVLVQIGNYIMKTKLKTVFESLSKLGFCIFLFQHRVIEAVLIFFNPEEWYKVLTALSITILLTVIFAKGLKITTDFLMRSTFFKRIEAKIMA